MTSQSQSHTGDKTRVLSGKESKFSNAPATPAGSKWVLMNDMDTSEDGPMLCLPKGSAKSDEKSSTTGLAGSSEASFFALPVVVRGMKFTKGKGKSLGGDNLPPNINLVPQLTRTYRFINTSASLQSATVASIIGSLGVFGTVVNSTAVGIASSFKINHLKIWPPAGGSAAVEWASTEGYTKDEIKDESIPTGITVSRSMIFRPPKLSLASFWTNDTLTSSNAIFKLLCTVGSIVDFNVSFTFVGAFGSIGIPVLSAAVGNMYYLALDTAHTYVPVNLPTTF